MLVDMREDATVKQENKTQVLTRLEAIDQRKQNYFASLEKKILNRYLECKGNIRVFVRVRPLLPIDFKAYGGTEESFEQITKATRVCNEKQIKLEMLPE